MKKINQEEYEILKKKQRKGHKYIAREKEGHVVVFTAYHGKSEHRWLVTTNRVGLKYESLFYSSEVFQFIHWTDEEPYNIQELIREYEFEKILLAMAEEETVLEIVPESEEKEVKDLEWAVKEIESLMTEESQSYPHDKMVEQEIVLGILNQLEVETLSPEWIDGNKEPFHHFETSDVDYYVSADLLQKLLVPKQHETLLEEWTGLIKDDFERLTKLEIQIKNLTNLSLEEIRDKAKSGGILEVPEKPVIPQFVMTFIKRNKESGKSLMQALYKPDLSSEWNRDVRDWLGHGDATAGDHTNQELFVRAWLAYPNIEIEQEPKYYAKVIGWDVFEKGYRKPYWCLLDKIPSKEKTISISVHGAKEILTKKEWEKYGINEGNAEFELVEELE